MNVAADIAVISEMNMSVPFFVLGLLFGSFLNCMAMRIVRKEDWVKGRSRCRDCGHELGFPDLIPVISFIFSRGRCRYCKKPISLRYPVTELLFAMVSVLIYLRSGISFETLRSFILACCLFVLSLTDIEERTIPNGCIITAIVSWIVTEPFLFAGWRDMWMHIAAMAVYVVLILCLSLVMDAVLKKDSLGGGDVKLIGVLALYLGFAGTMFMLFFASVTAIIWAFAARKLKRGQIITFGPFLSAAGLAMVLFGEGLVGWYMGLMGVV